MDLSAASIIVGIVSGLVGSFVGLGGGARLVYWLIEHKLDARYDQRYIPRQEVNVGIGERLMVCEEDTAKHGEKIVGLERRQDSISQEVQHLSTHISEQVLVALKDLTSEMREMRTEQNRYSQVQVQHAEMMKAHASALNQFQHWLVQNGSQLSLFSAPAPER